MPSKSESQTNPAPATRDYFAELYVAALFGDDGWSVYFPKRDVGFDFIATKQVDNEILIRPVQVKGRYPEINKKSNNKKLGFNGILTATHPLMVLIIPFFNHANPQAPEHVAFLPLSVCKKTSKGGWRCAPCNWVKDQDKARAEPRRDFRKYFGKEGLASVGKVGWGVANMQSTY